MKLRMLSSTLFTALLIGICESSFAFPHAWTSSVCWYVANPTTLSLTPSLPLEKEAAKIATATATTISAVTAYPTSVTQGSRALSVLQMLSCGNPDSGVDEQSWLDNPTSLSIGDSQLSHHVGAVVGNWAIFSGTAIICKGIAVYFNDKKTMFPGILIIPAAFLFAPTTTSAMTLSSQGNFGQKFLGVLTLSGQVFGMGAITIFLLPENFRAKLVKEDWVDTNSPGYVKHFGLLFDDYRLGRQWFIGTELLISSTTGLLKSSQATGGNCGALITLSAVNSIVYLTSLIFLHPHRDPKDKIFYVTIAALQATALSIQAIASWSSSAALEKVRPATEAIVMATEWALLLKSFYEIYNRAKNLHQYFIKNCLKSDPVPVIPATPYENSGLDERLIGSLRDDSSLNEMSTVIKTDVIETDNSAAGKLGEVLIPYYPFEDGLSIKMGERLYSRLSCSDRGELDKEIREILQLYSKEDELRVRVKAAYYKLSYPEEDEKLGEIAKLYPNEDNLHIKLEALLYDLSYHDESRVTEKTTEVLRQNHYVMMMVILNRLFDKQTK